MARPSDDDFEVVEEVVDDFDYFYEDDEEIIRNQKYIKKLKLISVGIAAFATIILLMIVGMIQMGIYSTKHIVTKQLMLETDYKNGTSEAYKYVTDFYVMQEINGGIVEGGTLKDIQQYIASKSNDIELEANYNELYLDGILTECEYYLGTVENGQYIKNSGGYLDTLELPDDSTYRAYDTLLRTIYIEIYNISTRIDELIKSGNINYSNILSDSNLSAEINNYNLTKTSLNNAYLAITK